MQISKATKHNTKFYYLQNLVHKDKKSTSRDRYRRQNLGMDRGNIVLVLCRSSSQSNLARKCSSSHPAVNQVARECVAEGKNFK